MVGPIAAITIYWPCCADTVKTVTTPQDSEASQVSPIKNTDNSLALLQDNSNKNGESQCDSSSRSNNNDIKIL